MKECALAAGGLQMLDSGWLKALDMPAHVTSGLAIGSGAVLLAERHELLYIHTLPVWVKAIIGVVFVMSALMALANLSRYGLMRIGAARERQQLAKEQIAQAAAERQRKIEYETDVLRYLDTLNRKKRKTLAYLTTHNEQSFNARIGGSSVSTLVQKGLLVPGKGVASAVEWPYTVPDFVWEELQRRKAEFLYRD